jgi:hypothetical protein
MECILICIVVPVAVGSNPSTHPKRYFVVCSAGSKASVA